jgi:hypothetical protein
VNADLLALGQGVLRGTDSNSLLRMYDLLRAVIKTSPSPRERERADKALGRIAKELQKRHVPL